MKAIWPSFPFSSTSVVGDVSSPHPMLKKTFPHKDIGWEYILFHNWITVPTTPNTTPTPQCVSIHSVQNSSVTILSNTGVDAHPSSTSGRCILGFWWVFTIVLVAAYTDNLTAVLTVAIPPSPIGSLGQLLAQDAIQPIVLAGSSFETLFQVLDWFISPSKTKYNINNPFQDFVNTLTFSHCASMIDRLKTY